jgi:hypothetical protein
VADDELRAARERERERERDSVRESRAKSELRLGTIKSIDRATSWLSEVVATKKCCPLGHVRWCVLGFCVYAALN